MFSRSLYWCLVGAFLFFFAILQREQAQVTTGSVVGTVTDQSGGAVASAPVSLINTNTNETMKQTTNADGLYQFVNVPPGEYRIEIQQPGFQKEVRQHVVVQTASTVRIDMSLSVGNVSQTIEVTSQTPLVQPETSSLGTVVDQRLTNELPLNGQKPDEPGCAGSVGCSSRTVGYYADRNKSICLGQLSDWRRHGESEHGLA